MDPLVKKILNSLKCPICDAPIDMTDYKKMYNYGCVRDINHYLICIKDDNLISVPFLSVESVNIYDNCRKYQLTQIYDQFSTNVKTEILVLEVDLEKRVQFNFKNNQLILDKKLFDFTNFNIDKAINRIKTVYTFY